MATYQTHKILIWGKTYPEYSTKYGETVCTGGVLEDGSPVRLYPIPFRYLQGERQFKLFDVIQARIIPAQSDTRPESMRLDADSIEVIDHISTDNKGWKARAEWLFRNPTWQFDNYDDMFAAYESRGASIGVIRPAEVLDVKMEPRTEETRESFETRLRRVVDLSQQSTLFESMAPELKELEYIPERPVIKWRCSSPSCGVTNGHKLHSMQVIDWGTIELLRKKGPDAVVDALAQRLTIQDYDVRMFLGNFRTHPNRFGIVGLWYPKRYVARASESLDLFSGSAG